MRRKNGEGTIYRRQCRHRRGGRCRCLWVGELTLGYEGGRRIKKTYANKDLAALQRALNNGKFIIDNVNAADGAGFISGLPFDCDDKGYTVASWVSYWLDTYKRPIIKLSTLDRYEYSLMCHIMPHIGAVKLAALTVDSVQTFYNTLRDNGLSSSSIKKVHNVLNPAMRQALRNGLIKTNPCDGVVIPKSGKRQPTAFTADEQRIFESSCPRTVYGDFFRFVLNTGLRVGEAAALTWSDVADNVVTVDKTISVVKVRGSSGGSLVGSPRSKRRTLTTSPKTLKSVRSVPLNSTVRALVAHRRLQLVAHQSAEHGRDDKPVDTGGLLFPSANGTTLNYHNIRRAFCVILARCGLPPTFTIHSLRHTFATRLIERGADAKTVSELLGHASVKFTLDVYTHVAPDTKAAAVALLDS